MRGPKGAFFRLFLDYAYMLVTDALMEHDLLVHATAQGLGYSLA